MKAFQIVFGIEIGGSEMAITQHRSTPIIPLTNFEVWALSNACKANSDARLMSTKFL